MDNKKWEESVEKTREEMQALDLLCSYLVEKQEDIFKNLDPNSFWLVIVDVIKLVSKEWGIRESHMKGALAEVLDRGDTAVYNYLKNPLEHPLPAVPWGYFEKALREEYGENLTSKRQQQARVGELLMERLVWLFSVQCEELGDIKPKKTPKRMLPKNNTSHLIVSPLWNSFGVIAKEIQIMNEKSKKEQKVELDPEVENGAFLVWCERKQFYDMNKRDFDFFLRLLSLSDEAVHQLMDYNIFRINQIQALNGCEEMESLISDRRWIEKTSKNGISLLLVALSRMTIKDVRNERCLQLFKWILAYRVTFDALVVFILYMNILTSDQKTTLRKYAAELSKVSRNHRLHRLAEQSVEKEGIEEATRKSEEFLGKYYY